MTGQRQFAEQRLRGRDEAVQDQGGLPGSGRPGQRGEAVQREGGGDPVQVVQVTDLDRDLAAGIGRRGMVPPHGGRARQERADDGARVGGQLSRSALGDNGPAMRSGGRAELDDPVRGGDEIPLVFYDDDGIAVRGQGSDRLAQPLDIARVQSHGRLVEHVEHAGGAGAHRGGQLDALPLPR
jgi:hypothetical protein